MKKTVYTIIAAAIALTSCNTEVIITESKGEMMLDLSCSPEYNIVGTKAESDEDIINNLSVKIVRPADNWTKTFEPFSSIRGTVVALGSGDYTITASSPVKEDAAYDQPVFEGSKDFTISTGQVTNVSLTCKVANVKVSIQLTENFVEELSDYSITVTNGKGILKWEKNANQTDFKPVIVEGETLYTGIKAGYFSVAPLTIQVNGHRSLDNTAASTTYYIDNPKAADHHILKLDANVTGTLGGISITIDNSVNDIENTVTVPGFEEIPVPGDEPQDPGTENPGTEDPGTDPEPSTAPTVTWNANPTFAPMNIDDNLDASLVVNAPEKIAQFKVEVDSPSLSPYIPEMTSDGSTTLDLVNDEKVVNLFNNTLKIPAGSALVGQTSVNFFITSLVKMINMYNPAPGTQHHFILKVTDEKNQILSQKVTFVTVE